ncbi:hypothetical protein SAMN05443377_10794 [Propionibacterium cyclohexanicum]|uniref:MarR family protein n=1 Tax=Propionibacterium cyclohexanicum TaxID=64702 RepID=A0A1H9RHX0_9ACTN|nr:hypothetical protein [Propionibacterium cyclohexanicum]SER72401.1 hypothetical protein SAMN05443377_10794 [Propionibacterium cyclohexanicum]
MAPDNGTEIGAADRGGIDDFVANFGALMAASGMPGLTGHVFALLLAAPDAQLTARQIGESLHISPAAVSGATKYLADVGITRRLRVPGSRQVMHALVNEDWYDILLTRNNVMEATRSLLLAGCQAAGGPDTRAGRRLWLNAELFKRLGAALGETMEKWRAERPGILAQLPRPDEDPRGAQPSRRVKDTQAARGLAE